MMAQTACRMQERIADAARPSLPPAVHPRIRNFLQNEDMLFDLVDRFGSPLNLIFPQNIHDNIQSFEDIYKKHSLRGRIYYTSKPCKSHALIREVHGGNAGIDVSSALSLKTAIACGWKGADMCATGPKNRDYLNLAIQSGALINVDNIDELKQILDIHASFSEKRKVNISLRVADAGAGKTQFLNENDTPFGIRTQDMDWVLSYLKDKSAIFSLNGFSWHSSSASDQQRIAAAENLLRLTFDAIKNGFPVKTINIGGGFPIMYADSCQQWADYIFALKESVMGKIPPQIWNKGGLGFRMENGTLKGNGVYPDHAPVDARGEDLERRLNYRLPSMGNVLFADIVRDTLLDLSIEPGRGLLDQCGVTIGRVAFTKKSGMGENIAGLEMNRSNLHSDQIRILTEPQIFTRRKSPPPSNGEGIFYTGNLCLFYDMLQYNKTYPAFMPEQGDLVAFMNTAAYQMDFTESETLMQPIAAKITLTQTQGAWTWVQDQNYRKTT